MAAPRKPAAKDSAFAGQLTKAGTPRKRPARPGEGQPTKYDPSYCQKVIEAGAQGYSLGAFAGMIRVARFTIDTWAKEHAEFSGACIVSAAARQHFWESRAVNVSHKGGGPGTAQIIQFALKNCGAADWRDKQEVAMSGEVSLISALDAIAAKVYGKGD